MGVNTLINRRNQNNKKTGTKNLMRLSFTLLFAIYLTGCSFGATAPLVVAGLGVTEYGRFKSEIRERAEACRASEDDLLPRSVDAISRGNALDLIPAFESVYNGDFSDEMKAQALYQIGLIYMNEYNQDRDDQKAIIYFERLKLEFPSSSLCADVDEHLAIINQRRESAVSYDSKMLTIFHQGIQARAESCVADEAALLPEAVDAISKKQAYKAIKVFLALHQDESLPLIEREHALFQVGLIYMSKANVHRDDEHAIYYFRKLLTQHPDSLYCVDAQARIDEIYTRQNQG